MILCNNNDTVLFFPVACIRGTHDIVASNGTITVPNYPNNIIPYGIFCAWRITVPAGYRVQLTFEAFRLHKSSQCNDQRLVIRNGNSEFSPLIGRYCGNIKPPIATSSGRSLMLRFWSYVRSSNKGFRARYVAVPATTIRPGGTLRSIFIYEIQYRI